MTERSPMAGMRGQWHGVDQVRRDHEYVNENHKTVIADHKFVRINHEIVMRLWKTGGQWLGKPRIEG